jgi:acetyltransferase-like isoleucine patch superfamily enzyme
MKIAVIGSALAGGGVQIIDILLDDHTASAIRIYDDDERAQGSDVLGVPVVGTLDRLLSDHLDGLVDSAVIAVGSISPREKLYKKYSSSTLAFPNIISSKSTISRSALLGKGNVILPYVYIGPRACICNNNYFTTATVLNHDSIVGSHCYFSTSVSIAGRVSIGDRVRLDTACSVTADAVIVADSLIGPGESFGPIRGH